MDQRFMELPATLQNGDLQVNGPQNANIAPPGWYMVFVVDENGVPSESKIVQVEAGADIQAPSATGPLSAVARTDGADLSWPAASDNKAVTEYRVFRSTTSGFTPSTANRVARVKSGTTYSDRGVPAGTHYYSVRAVDKAGNVGPASPQASVTVAGDTTAPAVSLTAPTSTTVSGTLNVTASASDAAGVQSVQFRLDGQNLGAADTAAPYSFSWDTRDTADASHSLTAVARDLSGNLRTSSARTVRVNNTGVVAAYGFEETSGTAALDPVRGYNGAITGATRTADGRYGRALSFDGVNDWVTVPDKPEVDLVTGGTVEAWVKPAVLGDWRSVIMKEIPGALPWALYASSPTSVPAAHVQTTPPSDLFGPAPFGLSTWTHLAMTWDQSTLRLYVDGAEIANQPAVGQLPGGVGDVRIGGNSVSGQFFSGLIDEVRVFDHARTRAEIVSDLRAPVITP
jgi:hypothetical protein